MVGIVVVVQLVCNMAVNKDEGYLYLPDSGIKCLPFGVEHRLLVARRKYRSIHGRVVKIKPIWFL